MLPHARHRFRLALPLVAALVMLLTTLIARPANAATTIFSPIAFQGSSGNLWIYTPGSGGYSTFLGMAADTSPSIAFNTSSPYPYSVAFQAAGTGHLLIYYTQSNGMYVDTHLGMAAGTSPSIGQNGFVAFQGSSGNLWWWDGNQGHDTFLGMAPGTSPSIVGNEIAFQGSNNDLYLFNTQSGQHSDKGLGMAPLTSPSMTFSQNDYWVAYQANTGTLWYWQEGQGAKGTGLGVAAGTSPSMDWVPGPDFINILFQANTGYLWSDIPGQPGKNSFLGMNGGSSPSFGLSYNNGLVTGPEESFQANNDDLYVEDANTGEKTDTGLAMAFNTSPSTPS